MVGEFENVYAITVRQTDFLVKQTDWIRIFLTRVPRMTARHVCARVRSRLFGVRFNERKNTRIDRKKRAAAVDDVSNDIGVSRAVLDGILFVNYKNKSEKLGRAPG